jgi:hypothetical protein
MKTLPPQKFNIRKLEILMYSEARRMAVAGLSEKGKPIILASGDALFLSRQGIGYHDVLEGKAI